MSRKGLIPVKKFSIADCTESELFAYVEKNIIPQLTIFNENETITNPFSGIGVELKPIQVAIYDYIRGYELLTLTPIYHIVTKKERDLAYTNTLAAKDYFMMKWNKKYLLLLD